MGFDTGENEPRGVISLSVTTMSMLLSILTDKDGQHDFKITLKDKRKPYLNTYMHLLSTPIRTEAFIYMLIRLFILAGGLTSIFSR